MKDLSKHQDISIDSYISKNRNKLDEALVSLRLMKVVDDFLINREITKRDFAKKIDCSESYVSQLMSGIKKFNVSFINKFEKAYDAKIDFKLSTKNALNPITENTQEVFLSSSSDSSVQLGTNIIDLVESEGVYTIEKNSKDYLQLVDTEKQLSYEYWS